MAIATRITRTSSHVSTLKKVEHGLMVDNRPPTFSAFDVVDSAVVTPPRRAMNGMKSTVNDSSGNSANIYEALRLSPNTSSTNTPSHSQGLLSPPPPNEL
jgi:hypothetical protein